MPNKLSSQAEMNVAHYLQGQFIPRLENLVTEAIQDLSGRAQLDEATAREVRSHIRQTFINYLLSKDGLDQTNQQGGS